MTLSGDPNPAMRSAGTTCLRALRLAGATVGVAVLAAGLSAQASEAVPVRATATAAAPSWPMFRFGSQHTGVQPSESSLTPVTVRALKPLWTATPEVGECIYSVYLAPAEVGGIVYTGGNYAGAPSAQCSVSPYRLFALKASTGATLWSVSVGSLGPSVLGLMSVAVADNVVYVVTAAGELFALDAATGKLLSGWPITPATMRPTVKNHAGATCQAVTSGAGQAVAPLTIAGGQVFYQTTAGCVFDVEASPGGTPVLEWFFAGSGKVSAGGLTSPAVAYGHVYVGTSDGWVWDLSQATGVPVWKAAIDTSGGGLVDSSPSVAGPATDAAVYVQASGGKSAGLYHLSAASGTVVWHDPYGGTSSPAIDRGIVYAESGTHVDAVSAATGKLAWAASIGGTVGLGSSGFGSSPAIANGVVYVGSTGPGEPSGPCGGFCALSAATGAKLYADVLPASGSTYAGFGSAAVANGWVYDTVDNGGVTISGLPQTEATGFTVPKSTVARRQ